MRSRQRQLQPRPGQALPLPLARWPLLGMESHLRSDGEKLAGTQLVVR
jgi:hypothetical protein